ncbi:MAG: type 4a pilus biogenesis protein PilO [Elusimicrobia bacterium]|nr:type 4a pilus biogenesis protein PilO [Elusimicrobiota bacterium]
MAKINLKLTPQQQKILAGAVIGLVGGGYCYISFFWSPISQKIEEANKTIAEVEGKIDKAEKQAARLPHLQAELAELNQQAIEAEKRLPKKKSTADILVTVSQLAETYHVNLLSFTPGSSTSRQFFIELSYPVSIKGTFHNIGKFLAAVSLEERIFNVQNVMYTEPVGDAGEMQVTFTLVSYQYKG